MNRNQSQPFFQEPDFTSLDEFITYCSIFDPSVSTESGTVIKQDCLRDSRGVKDVNKFIVRLFQDSLGINLEEAEDFVLFICHAPIYFENPEEYSLKIVEDRSKKLRVNTSWEELKKSQVHSQKTYACFRGLLEKTISQRWLVIKTPTETEYVEYTDSPEDMMVYTNPLLTNYPEDMIGSGNTLLEADLTFYNARIENFANLQQKIFRWAFDYKIPFTKQQMFEACKKLDALIDPNTVICTYLGYELLSLEFGFKSSCNSKTRRFTFELSRNFTSIWEVVKFVEIPAEIDTEFGPQNILFKDKFIGTGRTVEDALKASEFEHQRFIEDEQTLNQRISSILEKRDKETEMEDAMSNHEERIEWYGGEDNFPEYDQFYNNNLIPITYEVNKATLPLSMNRLGIGSSEIAINLGIPLEAYEYIVNGKSALGWMIDRYQAIQDNKSDITNPNDWSDDPRYIVDLVEQVVQMSLETVKIVEVLPQLNELHKS